MMPGEAEATVRLIIMLTLLCVVVFLKFSEKDNLS